MTSSAEEAILLLKRWQSSLSWLRIVWGSSHSRMAFHGNVRIIEGSQVTFWGTGLGTELVVFDISKAVKIDFRDARDIPSEFPDVAELTETFVSMLWPDNSRLSILEEKKNPST